eukprot:gene13577-biopygen11667
MIFIKRYESPLQTFCRQKKISSTEEREPLRSGHRHLLPVLQAGEVPPGREAPQRAEVRPGGADRGHPPAVGPVGEEGDDVDRRGGVGRRGEAWGDSKSRSVI